MQVDGGGAGGIACLIQSSTTDIGVSINVNGGAGGSLGDKTGGRGGTGTAIKGTILTGDFISR